MQKISTIPAPTVTATQVVARPASERTVSRPRLSEIKTGHHPKVGQAVQMAKNWNQRRKEQPTSIVLVAADSGRSGVTGKGVGKTHIAKCCLWAAGAYFVGGQPIAPAGAFLMADELMHELGDKRLAPSRKIARLVRQNTPVLVIDDVGTEEKSPYLNDQAWQIQRRLRYFVAINHCYENDIPMIITSNLRLAELARHIGDRAWSRLNEMAPKGFMLDLTGVPDYRLKKAGRAKFSA